MYNHVLIEKKWQKYWDENKTFRFVSDPNKPKYYVLDMFPYPSGKGLHVGHPKGYTATDILARYKLLNGFNVLHPIGWDAFGLPAEQYALDTGNHPEDFTKTNIDNFRDQLKKIGFYFDYDKEVNTTDPKYFKWTQWIFMQLFNRGLAEIKDVEVNWCPALGTVLSNEEILTDNNGNKISERGSHPVEKKPMRQWVLKITKYADKLLDNLEKLDWPESLKSLQRNWIGKLEGHTINFDLNDSDEQLVCFSTRIDTIYGVSFIAIHPKHELVKELINTDQKFICEKYIQEFNKLSELDLKQKREKTGVFTGSYAINPINGNSIPIWITDYVVYGVGTNALMGVPGHDQNDYDFAQKYNLKILEVIKTDDNLKTPYKGNGVMVNSGQFDGLTNLDAYEKISELGKKEKWAEPKCFYKLKDWLFSRQRYWGEPFPILFDEDNKPILIDEKDLPLILPKLNDIKPSESGKGPLANATDWLNIEINGKKYQRDTNTMPQWAGSCWYYLGYLLKQHDGSYLDLNSYEAKKIFDRWMPVDVYIGGQEHAVLHLLYARFWYNFFYDIGLVNSPEPFKKVINQGIILGPNGEKMSKSKGNVISPDDIILTHGADALRLYEAFMGPINATLPWSEKGLDGIRKWLNRVYQLYFDYKTNLTIIDSEQKLDNNLVIAYNQMIKSVANNIEHYQFNLAISDMMIFINHVYTSNQFYDLYMKNFAIILSIFAPHIGSELFSLFENGDVCYQKFPAFDANKLNKNTITIPVVINKKPKATIEVGVDLDSSELEKLALENDVVKNFIKDKKVLKIVTVKNKIVNIVVI